jgi:hypothetical protein
MFSGMNKKESVRKANVSGRHISLFPFITAYYCISSIFLVWRIDSFVKDSVIAPLYFLVPTGIGLLLFSLAGIHKRMAGSVGAGTLVLAGTFTGMVAVTLLYQDAERMQVLNTVFPYLYPVVLVLSLAGYFHARALLVISHATLRSVAVTLMWLAPVALLSYYFLFLKFSSFPLRDIFQETHFMKGAYELSRFQILNPYVTASYLSIIQIHQGLLNHFYNYDLLNSQWILPAYAYFFHLGCYAVFFSIFIREVTGIRLALALATAISPLFFIENMIMLESMLLVFFAILVRLDGDVITPRRALSIVFWLLLLFFIYSVYFNYLFVDHHVFSGNPSPYSGMWLVGLLLLTMTCRLNKGSVGDAVFVAFLAISMFAMHRGILLFFPMLLFVYLVYVAVFHGEWFKRYRLKKLLVASVFAGFSLLSASLLLFDYYMVMSQSGAEYWTSDVAFRIGEVLLRTPVIVGGGTGFNHSLVEYLRLSPPLVLLFVFLLLLAFVAHRWVGRIVAGTGTVSIDPEKDPGAAMVSQVLFMVLAIPPLVLLVHSTVPYVYRGAFLPAALTIGLFAVLYGVFHRRFMCGTSMRPTLIVVFVSAAGAFFSHFVLYGYEANAIDNANSYLKALLPLPQIGLVFLTFLLTLLAWRRWRVIAIAVLVPVSMVVSVATDAISFRSMFYVKAYGPQLPASGVISHYSEKELEAGRLLRSLPMKSLLISDPYTLSILRATTGLNSAYSFANINIVTEPKPYQDAFLQIADIGRMDVQRARDRLYRTANSIRSKVAAEGYYVWNKFHVADDTELMSAEQMYDHFIWVISARTFQWARGIDGYYPDDARMDDDFIERLHQYFDVLMNIDDRIIALRLKRSVTPLLLPGESLDPDCACTPNRLIPSAY